MEKIQKIYQFFIMTDETDVDELLMMWKTAGTRIYLWNNVENVLFLPRF